MPLQTSECMIFVPTNVCGGQSGFLELWGHGMCTLRNNSLVPASIPSLSKYMQSIVTDETDWEMRVVTLL